jgi:hypothetical protein
MHQPTEPGKLATQSNKLLVLFWFIVFAATFYCAFVLPFHFPLHEPVFSAAYTVGENNRVAAIAVAAISIFVTFMCWRYGSDNASKALNVDPYDSTQISKKYLVWGMVATLVCTALLGLHVLHLGSYYADEGYFVTQLRSGIVFHRRIYRDFEFAYGPALYLWPAMFVRLLAPIGFSIAAAYLVSLLAMEAIGIGLLFYIIKALPMQRRLKNVAFCLLTFGAFDLLLGLNYAVLRPLLPFAAVVLLSRQKTLWRAITIGFLGEILQLMVSPELGIAFGGAAIIYGVYRSFVSGWRWLGVSVASVIAGGLFIAFIGKDYISTLHEFSKGGFSLILEPLPLTLIFLATVVTLVPLAVGRSLRQDQARETSTAGLLIPFYVATLGMLPAALSRCDPLHIFCNGMGAYLLSFVAIDHARMRWRQIWIFIMAVAFAATQFQLIHAMRYHLFSDRALLSPPQDPYDDPDITAISNTVGDSKVTFPLNAPMRMIAGLTQTGQFQPDYYAGEINEFDQQAEMRRIADLRSAQFALVPSGHAFVNTDEIDNTGIKRLLRLGITYHARRTPFYKGALLWDELQTNWVPVGRFGTYTLYRKVR